ncbi:DUF1405 domain-containing protein [Thermoanaerobacterium sp. DL9XJH110]|jgi:uncharacterized membrane protein YpjA|uniref:DUF1405 domain-containing protein n=1 Tax=Thermoanaerobacterium sp. DL9XJH110 TaxID=3386643 RepID=UPI003BB780DD
MAFLKEPFFLRLLFFINFSGSLYGFYWYRYQLIQTPKTLWLFVPDSPTATALFTIALYFYIIKKPQPFFTLLACAWLIKYGLWAAIINTHYLLIGGNYTFTNFHLTLSHLGMAVEGALFINDIPLKKGYIPLMFLLMAGSDLLDYGLDIHPWFFDESQWLAGLVSAAAMTAGISVYSYCLYVRQKEHTAAMDPDP